MVLSDKDIVEFLERGALSIDPLDRENIEPASVDLHLGEEFKVTHRVKSDEIVLSNGAGSIDWLEQSGSVKVVRDSFVLATTKETVHLPDDIVGRVTGRSSLGRLGLSVHQTAGYIDPGFNGQITLEISNHGPNPVVIQEGDRICQISFSKLSSPALSPYGCAGSHYQEQEGATSSRMNF